MFSIKNSKFYNLVSLYLSKTFIFSFFLHRGIEKIVKLQNGGRNDKTREGKWNQMTFRRLNKMGLELMNRQMNKNTFYQILKTILC